MVASLSNSWPPRPICRSTVFWSSAASVYVDYVPGSTRRTTRIIAHFIFFLGSPSPFVVDPAEPLRS
ncbi:hypothetical protein CFC21_082834 [Triticum aestivum]|uniref:Uncharacterized protein n=3 Tax=Triticum TaxID=4564 RepID=A0A9R1AY00_TRITD|nr:hypothetical protein CFC21_082834 [Triticum aestivum]VAI44322.1 unnamed protein product [Triticum turgidum subsp. durum]